MANRLTDTEKKPHNSVQNKKPKKTKNTEQSYRYHGHSFNSTCQRLATA